MGVAKRRRQPLRDVRQMWREQTELDILSWLSQVFELRGGKEKCKILLKEMLMSSYCIFQNMWPGSHRGS